MYAFLAFMIVFTCDIVSQDHGSAGYIKQEYYIPMRDGVELYTAVYQPREGNRTYPILLTRTPYGCAPYGSTMPEEIHYNELLVKEGYIFVYQDIRGRSMSDGEDMINLKPVYSQKDPKKTDEVTDAYDTMDWLIKHIKNNNGKIGLYGNSYRGWTALMGALSGHPALKAVQSGAPCMDLYFEDFTRYGLFALGYTPIIDWFGTPKTKREEGPWWERRKEYFSYYDTYMNKLDYDAYDFFLKKGAIKNYGPLLTDKNYFLKYLKDHPDYDEARKERSAAQYLKAINCPILLVGGWNDEQNMYGILKSYEVVSKVNTSDTKFIVGPWNHGGYTRHDSLSYVGNIFYGMKLNEAYYKKEFEFFQFHLNHTSTDQLPAVSYFNTGTRQWSFYDKHPETKQRTFYLDADEKLSSKDPGELNSAAFFEYLSDPAKPVPYIEQDNFNLFVSKSFMTDDQRFAYKRPDVITFSTDVLTEDLTLSGKIQAVLKFATDHQDADIIVKLIDVYAMDRKPEPTDKPGLKMNGYQQMVRCGYIRGRYRESYSKPKPFVPNAVTDVTVELLDVFHTFKKGHKIMIQIQSSLFPLFDRNPQNYVKTIYEADDSDFVKANHRIYAGSKIIFGELK
jgi:putative CocE/NonD family hydrolase